MENVLSTVIDVLVAESEQESRFFRLTKKSILGVIRRKKVAKPGRLVSYRIGFMFLAAIRALESWIGPRTWALKFETAAWLC